MQLGKALSPKLEWAPALRFTLHRLNIFVEPSDDGPYPRLLQMKYAEVSNHPEPIAVYCVCHAAAIATPEGQKDLRRLKSHGFGLVTVDPAGAATILFSAIPLVQAIPEDEFLRQLKGLPRGIQQRVREAFDDYTTKPTNGVKSLSELVEGMIRKAGQDSARKKTMTQKAAKGSVSKVLDELHTHYPSARPAIGGARKFFNECRNPAHHWPTTKKASHQKYVDCRHHFLEGLRTVQAFRQAMKAVGLSGNLAKA